MSNNTTSSLDFVISEESRERLESLLSAEEKSSIGLHWVTSIVMVWGTGRANTSQIQRRLLLGYNRASRIVEKMNELGWLDERPIHLDSEYMGFYPNDKFPKLC